MSEFVISSTMGDYSVDVRLGASSDLEHVAVAIVDPKVLDRIGFTPANVIPVEGNEQSKSLAGCEEVLVAMNRAGVVRGDLVAAVGGGVVQDVATLSTSLYMRGIDWAYVPTTLMSMADSCIGGKSSINAGGIKNLVGNFHPPKVILVDPIFIPSLSDSALVSGLSEAVKICFARGSGEFEEYLDFGSSTSPGADEETAAMLEHVLRSKKWFVEIDEFDKAERQLLNFGHSFGHAWEAACGFRIPHGVGVAVGMLAAATHPAAVNSEAAARLEVYCLQLLRGIKSEIRAATAATDWSTFATALSHDKKNGKGLLRLVLPASGHPLEIREFPLDSRQLGIATDVIISALERVNA